VELTRSTVEAKAEEYREREPLYPVEAEQVETLPAAFAAGEFGWRDAAWVVRWYYRRYLGAYPDADRRAAEEAFGENDFETVKRVLVDAAGATDSASAVESEPESAAAAGSESPSAAEFEPNSESAA
jgi:hypothetical protein